MVIDWPMPTTQKQFQHFYWFADFYRQQDYHISQSGQTAELKTSQVGSRLCMVKLFNHLQTQLSDHEIQCFVPPIQRYSYYTTVEKTTFCCPPASIGSLTWEIESLVCNVQRDKPNPNSLFVPSSVQSQVGDIQPNSPAILVKNFFIDCSGGLSSLKTHLTMCQPVKYMTRINLLLLGLQDYSDCYQLPGNLGPI